MGKLLCEKNLRDVWCRNESVRAEIGQILHTHTHTHAAKLVVEIVRTIIEVGRNVSIRFKISLKSKIIRYNHFYPCSHE